MVQVEIGDHSPAVEKTLAELNLRARTGATVLALRRADGTGVGVPMGDDRLFVGDIVSLTGDGDAVNRARSLLLGEPDPVDTKATPSDSDLDSDSDED